MLDSRGYKIQEGATVSYYAEKPSTIHNGSWISICWGTVTKLTPQMVAIDSFDTGKIVRKTPNNVLVIRLPVGASR